MNEEKPRVLDSDNKLHIILCAVVAGGGRVGATRKNENTLTVINKRYWPNACGKCVLMFHNFIVDANRKILIRGEGELGRIAVIS